MGRTKIAAPEGKQTWKQILPGVVVSLVCLAVIFSLIDLDDLLEALRQADLRLLGLGILLGLVWLLVRGMVWRTLLQERASYKDVFFTLNEGYLLNNILPFRLGELGRAFLLGRKTSLDFWQVLPTILVERTLDMAMALGLFLGTLPFVAGVSWAQQAALSAAAIVGGGLLFIYILALNRGRVLSLLEKAGQRWPLVGRLLGGRAEAFMAGLAIVTDGRLFLKALGWSMFNWLLGAVQYYVLLWAFYPQARPLWAAFCLGAGSLGLAAPSSPGGLGVFEAAIVGALSVFDNNISKATAFALSTHLINYLLTGLLGSYALARDGETLAGLYKQLRALRQKPPAEA